MICCSFGFLFLIATDIEHLKILFVGCLYVFFLEMFIQMICPCKKIGYFILLSFFSELLIHYWYVTDINPLSRGWLTNIFFHSEDRVFFLLFPLLSRHCLVWRNLIYQFLVLHPVCFGFYHYLSNILKCFLCNINIRLKIIWKTQMHPWSNYPFLSHSFGAKPAAFIDSLCGILLIQVA